MITVSDVSVSFGGQLLFKDVDLKFTAGNCYGVIGANGAGKSTFLKVLCGDLEPTKGSVSKPAELRMSVLRQDHYAFDDYTVQDTVILGNKRLYDIMQEKDALYAKEDFSEEDGTRASELEAEFAELNGWEAESDASKLIQGLGLPEEILYQKMDSLTGNEKVKVLLAQCLFGNPDIILMDEPTNHLDVEAVSWLEDFLAEYFGTVIVVSHDRHFLNNVCTHIVDIDYGQDQDVRRQLRVLVRILTAHSAYDKAAEQARRGEDQGTPELHRAVLREQVEVQAGDLPSQAHRQADRRRALPLPPESTPTSRSIWSARSARIYSMSPGFPRPSTA